MPSDSSNKGYDKENEYFLRQNQALIERKRVELDAARREQEARQLKELHWMRCPKCGNEMAEEEQLGVKIDRCKGCRGVFFDAGELELMLQAHLPDGFLEGLKRLIKR